MYFVYVLKNPHGPFESHVVSGARETLRQTRALVCSGAQVKDLMFVSDLLFEDETHHSRSHKDAELHEKIDAALERAATPRNPESA